MEHTTTLAPLASIDVESSEKVMQDRPEPFIDNSKMNPDTLPMTGAEILDEKKSFVEKKPIAHIKLDSIDEGKISEQQSIPEELNDERTKKDDSSSSNIDVERTLSEAADSFYSAVENQSNGKSPVRNMPPQQVNPFENDDNAEDKEETLAEKFDDAVDKVGDFITNLFGRDESKDSEIEKSENKEMKPPHDYVPKSKFIDDNASETSTLYAVSEIYSEDFSVGASRHIVDDLDPAAIAAERARIEELQKILEPGAVLKKASSYNPALRSSKSARDIERAKDANTIIKKSLVSGHIQKFRDIESKSLKSFDGAPNRSHLKPTSYGGNVAQYTYSQKAAPRTKEQSKPPIRVSGQSSFKLPSVPNDVPFSVIKRGKSNESLHFHDQTIRSKPTQEWISRSKNLEEHTYTSDMINTAARMEEINKEKEKQEEFEREQRTRSLSKNEDDEKRLIDKKQSKAEIREEALPVLVEAESSKSEAPFEGVISESSSPEILVPSPEHTQNGIPELESNEPEISEAAAEKKVTVNELVEPEQVIANGQLKPEDGDIEVVVEEKPETNKDTTENESVEDKIEISLSGAVEPIEIEKDFVREVSILTEESSPDLRNEEIEAMIEKNDIIMADESPEDNSPLKKEDNEVEFEYDFAPKVVLDKVEETTPYCPPDSIVRATSEMENETIVDKNSSNSSPHHSSDETETIVDGNMKKEVMDSKKGSDDGIRTPEANDIVKEANIVEEKKGDINDITKTNDEDAKPEKNVRKSRKSKKSNKGPEYAKATGGCCTIS